MTRLHPLFAAPILSLLALIVLAGCSSEKPAASGDGRNASGEVLPGSISDAMIPLDQVKSSAPAEDPSPVSSGGDGATPNPATPDSPEAIEQVQETTVVEPAAAE